MLFGPVAEKYGDGKPAFNLRQKIVLIVMDVFLLASLCYAMYVSHPAGDHFPAVFVRTYAPVFFPTFFLGIWLCRRFRDKPAEDEALAAGAAHSKG